MINVNYVKQNPTEVSSLEAGKSWDRGSIVAQIRGVPVCLPNWDLDTLGEILVSLREWDLIDVMHDEGYDGVLDALKARITSA